MIHEELDCSMRLFETEVHDFRKTKGVVFKQWQVLKYYKDTHQIVLDTH